MTAATRWTLAIVGLLGGNLVAMGLLIGAAHSEAPAIIPQYYEKAARYDDAIDQAASNRALGWRISPRWSRTGDFVADVTDRDGKPLVGAVVTIDKRPRSEHQRRGLYDLTITVRRGGDVFVQTTTAEAR
jgi:nitrogen fixation protein FixH